MDIITVLDGILRTILDLLSGLWGMLAADQVHGGGIEGTDVFTADTVWDEVVVGKPASPSA